jgi:hypothetical protein
MSTWRIPLVDKATICALVSGVISELRGIIKEWTDHKNGSKVGFL